MLADQAWEKAPLLMFFFFLPGSDALQAPGRCRRRSVLDRRRSH